MENEILFGAACFALGLALRGLWDGLRPRFAAWHRRLWRVYWRWRSRRRGGRPPLDPELIALIRQMSWENPLWGAPRIHGELLLLGYRLCQSSVAKYMITRRGRPGGGSWTAFLAKHADAIAAIDLLTAPSLLFGRLYAFVVLAHDRRRILHVEVTSHPSALWLACHIAKAFRLDPAPLFLCATMTGFMARASGTPFASSASTNRPTAPASPWQNGHVERLISSIRRECLDHQIILKRGASAACAASLRQLLQQRPNTPRPGEEFAVRARRRAARTHALASPARRSAP